jgi:hypothetical protein
MSYSVTASETSASVGSTLHCNWTSDMGDTSNDFVALYHTNAPDAKVTSCQIGSRSILTSSSGSHLVNFPIAVTGTFHWRVYKYISGSYVRAATSATITITAPSDVPRNPSQILVIYNSSDSDSTEVANYYKAARSVPTANMLGIALGTASGIIDQADWNSQVRGIIVPAVRSKLNTLEASGPAIYYLQFIYRFPWSATDTPALVDGNAQLAPGVGLMPGQILASHLEDPYYDVVPAYNLPAVTFTTGTPGKINLSSHGYYNNMRFMLRKVGSATLPPELDDSTAYYVINSTVNDFQVSASSGGTAINFSGAGSGTIEIAAANQTVKNLPIIAQQGAAWWYDPELNIYYDTITLAQYRQTSGAKRWYSAAVLDGPSKAAVKAMIDSNIAAENAGGLSGTWYFTASRTRADLDAYYPEVQDGHDWGAYDVHRGNEIVAAAGKPHNLQDGVSGAIYGSYPSPINKTSCAFWGCYYDAGDPDTYTTSVTPVNGAIAQRFEDQNGSFRTGTLGAGGYWAYTALSKGFANVLCVGPVAGGLFQNYYPGILAHALLRGFTLGNARVASQSCHWNHLLLGEAYYQPISPTAPTPTPPSITSVNSATFPTGSAGTFTVTATGVPGGGSIALSKSGTLPAGVSFTDNHDGTATIAGTPGTGTEADYPITITANNGVTPNATQSFILHVTAGGTSGIPPTITSPNTTTFNEGVFGTFAITTTP